MQTRHAKRQLPFPHACRKRCQLDYVDVMFPSSQQHPLLEVSFSRSPERERFMAFQVLRPERALRPSSNGR